MTVTLNEEVLSRLLETEDGPVGRLVARTAAVIVAGAQANVRAYFASAPSLDVDRDIGFRMQGSTAIVGIADAGEKSRRLARAQAEGKVNWLTRALEASRG